MPETLTQLNEIWSSVLAKMTTKLSSQPDGKRMIDSFFADSRIDRIEGDRVYITVSTGLAAVVIEKNYKSDIASYPVSYTHLTLPTSFTV